MNLYAFVGNDPVNATDQLGLCTIVCTAGAAAALGCGPAVAGAKWLCKVPNKKCAAAVVGAISSCTGGLAGLAACLKCLMEEDCPDEEEMKKIRDRLQELEERMQELEDLKP